MGNSADTQKWVAEEMAYTRGVLDPLPGRDAIHKRLTELLSIGSITQPEIGGKYYFYMRREGMQNQPVLYVREGVEGKDRVLVDANQLAADGTIALDWYHPSENGKYLAYGTSPSGSEMSTLHILETKTGNRCCPIRLSARGRAALRGCRTTRDFITRDIRRRATCRMDRRCTTGMCSIMNWEPIRRPIRRFLARGAIRRIGPA